MPIGIVKIQIYRASKEMSIKWGGVVMICEDLELYIVDYVEEILDEKKRKEIDEHLHICEKCRNEVETFREFPKLIELNNIKPNEKFINNIEERVKSRNVKISYRRGIFKTILIAAVILCMSIITVIPYQNVIINLMRKEAIVEEIIDKGFGEGGNISKIDKVIKVTITSVAADDTQILVFYRIENLKRDKIYAPILDDGVFRYL